MKQWMFPKKSELVEFQLGLCRDFHEVVRQYPVEAGWSSMRDEYGLEIYSPRIDVAVGPFATHERLGHIYDEMMDNPRIRRFIERLIEYNRLNLERHDGFVRAATFEEITESNYNARCLIAIEIENQVSRKHLMGGAINASALGRIGIVIPWSNEKLKAFVKLVRYLQYLKYAEKNTFNTTNLLIITREQIQSAIEEALQNNI